jgi:hypothetical protein
VTGVDAPLTTSIQDRMNAVAGNATLEAQYRLERSGRKLLKPGSFLREMLRDDALGRGVDPDIGHLVEPLLQLLIEILEIAEAAAEEEVLADVAIWPFDRSTLPLTGMMAAVP